MKPQKTKKYTGDSESEGMVTSVDSYGDKKVIKEQDEAQEKDDFSSKKIDSKESDVLSDVEKVPQISV